jgi:hypothetical protein
MKIYIKNDGQDSGPFSKDELQGKIYSGELSRTIWARLDGAEEWVPLESLLGGKPVPRISPETLSVTLEQLRDRKEKTALVWLYIASVPVWIFLILWTVAGLGNPLLILGIFWLLHAFGELWFSAHLKTNAVRVSAAGGGAVFGRGGFDFIEGRPAAIDMVGRP